MDELIHVILGKGTRWERYIKTVRYIYVCTCVLTISFGGFNIRFHSLCCALSKEIVIVEQLSYIWI